MGDAVEIDLLSDYDMLAMLREHKQTQPRGLLRSVLTPLLSKRLVLALQDRWWAKYAETPMAEIPDRVLDRVANNLNAWQIKPSGTEGYRTAEVTLGGVSTDVLSTKTMACKDHLGLYFIGEVVDVTGHLGGFNFQWAWSSGYVAGLNA